MKTGTGEDNLFPPILFLFFCSFMLGIEFSNLLENMQKVSSVILAETAIPVLFSDSILTTILNILRLLIPVVLFIYALKQKSVLLKITYIICTIPLVLSNSVIIKLGYGSLFIVRIVALFVVTILLINYILRATEYLKSKLKQSPR
ncbi:MAG: hypothetical protein ACYDEX_22000 [Mobilitalea sp.]